MVLHLASVQVRPTPLCICITLAPVIACAGYKQIHMQVQPHLLLLITQPLASAYWVCFSPEDAELIFASGHPVAFNKYWVATWYLDQPTVRGSAADYAITILQ